MPKLHDEKGFTFTEILVALLIMTIGFLAMSQMQFLSLKQKQDAETGTIATNVIQFIADRDMAEAKRVHLLNSIAYIEAQAGRLSPGSSSEPHLQHCIGEANVCSVCPCNPLEAITLTAPVNDTTVTYCAIVNVHDFDPLAVQFETQGGSGDPCDGGGDDVLYIIKQVATTIDNFVDPPLTTLEITYAVKTPHQFKDTTFESVNIKDSIATQNYTITSHREDWTEVLAGGGWNAVEIPHIP